MRVTKENIDEAAEMFESHFGTDKLFNRAGWEYIVSEHGGKLPVRIKAVPEGTRVRVHNALMTVENTDPNVPWLTNFLETLLSQVWYPSTVATLSHEVWRMIGKYLDKTGDRAGLPFKLHDFGFRGAACAEAAGLGGCAHLVNFIGTDTLAALTCARDYYGVEGAAGFSVPAAEHSTITSWGREHEVEAFRNMIDQYGNYPFYSVVSDSYDLWKAAKHLWGEVLRDEVMQAQGTLVVRPDSGYPPVVVTQLLNVLGDRFGYEVNEKGYKVLHPKVRVIQGDGMNFDLVAQTLATMEQEGWSADNTVYGMGGGLLQRVNRDTQKFAFKCSSAIVGGEQRDVFKDPETDPGKVSKKGRFSLVIRNGEHFTAPEGAEGDLLERVYENGEILKRFTLDEVRANAGTAIPALA